MWYNVCIISWFSSLCMLRLNSFKFFQPSCLNEDTEGRLFLMQLLLVTEKQYFYCVVAEHLNDPHWVLSLFASNFTSWLCDFFLFPPGFVTFPSEGSWRGKSSSSQSRTLTITRPDPECTFLFLRGIPVRQDERNNVQFVKNNKNKLFIWTVSWHVLQMMYDAKQLWSPSLFTCHL